MKRILFASIFALTTLSGSSQSIVQENKSWNVVKDYNGILSITELFKITGDTTIGDTEYKKLYRAMYPDYTNWVAYGALRENADEVYFYMFMSDTEAILYDFGLMPGDTFSSVSLSEFGICAYEMQVTAVDTVAIENGDLRKRLHFINGSRWIEGIGSLNGIAYDGITECMTDITYSLSCCYQNEELIFQPHFVDSCMVNTMGLNDVGERIKHTLYPNPFSQSTSFRFDDTGGQPYSLKVFSATGKRVKIIENILSGEATLAGDELPSGIYFYVLSNAENETASGKFIKL